MNKSELDDIRHQMKEKQISVSFLSGYVERSASWVGACLNGHYPFRYAHEKGIAQLPVNIARALKRFGIESDMRQTSPCDPQPQAEP